MAATLVTPTAINPLRAGMRGTRTIEPCVVVVFGATGDLTHRKLIPALYNLALEQPMPAELSVVGVGRRPLDNNEFRQQALDAVDKFSRRRPVNPNVWETFSRGLFYCQAPFDDPDGYVRLKNLLDQLDRDRGTLGNRIFYLSTQPSYYPTIIENLREADMARRGRPPGSGWARIVVEKPFGHDLASAQALNDLLSTAFREDQIYRIDHYLGKETVQNILVAALRQWHLRADLEPPLHRPRADHGWPRASASRAAAATTRRPAPCAT